MSWSTTLWLSASLHLLQLLVCTTLNICFLLDSTRIPHTSKRSSLSDFRHQLSTLCP
ncbi:hypothetical protein BDZ91DRAFT_719056 [Kalaharituber pfeilii]|nr:hypothetical protein BDZ91DRAFT_719056 [Kalaharituber pfeilii]